MKIEENKNELNSPFREGKTPDFTGGFSVPENYFDKLQGDIDEKVSRIPNLYSVKKENPFTVPGEYFTELENSVQEKISLAKERSASAPFFLRPRLIPVMAMVLVAVCTVTFIVMNRSGNSVSEKDISFSDIYNSSYVADMDEASLYELVKESSQQNTNTSQYENYLIEDDTDIQTLTEEL